MANTDEHVQERSAESRPQETLADSSPRAATDRLQEQVESFRRDDKALNNRNDNSNNNQTIDSKKDGNDKDASANNHLPKLDLFDSKSENAAGKKGEQQSGNESKDPSARNNAEKALDKDEHGQPKSEHKDSPQIKTDEHNPENKKTGGDPKQDALKSDPDLHGNKTDDKNPENKKTGGDPKQDALTNAQEQKPGEKRDELKQDQVLKPGEKSRGLANETPEQKQQPAKPESPEQPKAEAPKQETPEQAKPEQPHLTEQQAKDASVRRGEGPYQVASRLLGKDSSHQEKMSLAVALKEQYNKETNGQDPHMRGLQVGQSLLNENNYKQVMDRISNKPMQEKINSKIDHSSQSEKPQQPEKPKQPEKPQQQEKPKEPEKPEQPKEPEKQNPPEQAEKGPLGTKFEPVKTPQPEHSTVASVYGDPQGTSSGRYFNPKEMTAAVKPELARELGLKNGDVLRVTHNGKSVDVVYTDAGPFVKGRGLDLSTAAGKQIGITESGIGIGKVTFQKIGREPGYLTAPRKA